MTYSILKRQFLQTLFKLPLKNRVLNKTSKYVLNVNPLYFTNHNCLISTSCFKYSLNQYTITFVKANGERITAKGNEGDSLLDVVVNNNLDLDGFGACEGTLTCSTCHCIFKQENYDKLPEEICDLESDMLDLAFEVSDTSRLGCQIHLSKDLDGAEVRLPATINDLRT